MKISKKKVFTLLIIVFLLCQYIPSEAILIKPGRLDHFVLKLPDSITAGEETKVELQVYDKYDNLITNFATTGKDIQITATGEAVIKPQVVNASSFINGTAHIRVMDKKAEDIVLSFYEAGSSIPLYTKELTISPAKFDHFIIKTPDSAQAGKSFEVRIIAKDSFGNTVREDAISKDIKLLSIGEVELNGIETPNFKEGMSVISLMAEKTGVAVFEVKDITKGVSSRSGDILITPSSLDHFTLSTPFEVTAGEPFTVSITAMDVYNNIVSNYSSYGGGVNINSSGKSVIIPSYIKPSDFKDGQVTVNLTYKKAEDISLSVIESGKKEMGSSSLIRVNPGGVERFIITTPEDAIAGERFRIKIAAYDRFDNIIKNYNLKGSSIILKSSGTGTLTPNTVPASEFIEGVAAVDVVYTKAESFSLSVSIPSKEKAPEVIEKPKTTTLPIERTKPEAVKPKVKPTEKAPLPPKAVKQNHSLTRKEMPRKIPIEFAVTDINIIEAENKALFVISIPELNDALNAKESLESSGGKDWLRIRLSPALNKITKPLKFKSNYIGEVRVRAGISAKEIDVLFEILPAKVKYDIERSKDSLIISVTAL